MRFVIVIGGIAAVVMIALAIWAGPSVMTDVHDRQTATAQVNANQTASALAAAMQTVATERQSR